MTQFSISQFKKKKEITINLTGAAANLCMHTHTYHEAEVTAVQCFLCTGEDVRIQSLSKPNHRWSEEAVTACLLTPKVHANMHTGPHKRSKQTGSRERSRALTDKISYLGSCSTGMLASSESASGALRGHLFTDVVSL